jgi:hypothetical protein
VLSNLADLGGSGIHVPATQRIIAGARGGDGDRRGRAEIGHFITAQWAPTTEGGVRGARVAAQEQSAGCLDLIMRVPDGRDGTEVLTALGLDARGPEQEVILEGIRLCEPGSADARVEDGDL